MITTVMWERETLAHSGAMRSALRMSQVPQVTLVFVSVWVYASCRDSAHHRGAAEPRNPGHVPATPTKPSLRVMSDPEYLIKFKPS